MKYKVLFNNSYMNSFKTYTEACDFRDWLETKFKNCSSRIKIVSID